MSPMPNRPFEILQDNLPTSDELSLAPVALRRAVDAAAFAAAAKALPGAAAPSAETPVIIHEGEPDWSPHSVEAPGAWQLEPRPPEAGFPAGGKRRGAEILVGHPDSGYRKHRELWESSPVYSNRVRADLDRDFIDGDFDAENEGGDHGLSTGSVIMSRDNQEASGFCVTGVAPEAELAPLRVTKNRLFIPAPVLLSGGVQRLRDAIYYAISAEVGCHVLSISLGWFGNQSLYDAILEAVRRNVIVCAAAGNYVGFVVWPASYPEVISVAGSTWDRQAWSGSCRGRRVDITAPAQNVWVASVDQKGQEIVTQSSGTSFAVATTAGIAALWLAYHGRSYLLDHYQGEFPLSSVFKQVLATACDPPPQGHAGLFGAGIVNARKTLAAPLPSLAAMRNSVLPSFAALTASMEAHEGNIVARVETLFDSVPPADVRTGLSALLRTPEAQIDEFVKGTEDELLFHILTTPALREKFIRMGERPVRPGMFVKGALMTQASEANEIASLYEDLIDLESISERLRGKIS